MSVRSGQFTIIKNIKRLSVIVVLFLMLIPVAWSGISYSDPTPTGETNVSNITFISAQGDVNGNGAGVYAVATNTRELIWSHTSFVRKYFDVDPIGKNRILFVAQTTSNKFEAIVMNWHTDEILLRFEVPSDTHDVDRLSSDRFIVADKVDNRIYIYNTTTSTTTWQFRFENHYPHDAGEGITNDYTHLNDVDVVDNGSAFLVSPRNFDRLVLIDRENRSIRWELGEENNYEILYEQHNPVLLDSSPPTILVADSENNRVVEYRRVNGQWKRIWTHSGALEWPRDADRLPNGNTLIADSHGFRAVEINPSGAVVWQYSGINNPYDVERVEYGDEPQGPSMVNYSNRYSVPESQSVAYTYWGRIQRSYEELYFLASWILPLWVGKVEFGLLGITILLTMGWVGIELIYVVPQSLIHRISHLEQHLYAIVQTAAAVGFILGIGLAFSVFSRGDFSGFAFATGMLLALTSILVLSAPENLFRELFGIVPTRLFIVGRIGVACVGLLSSVGMAYAGIRANTWVTTPYLAMSAALALIAIQHLSIVIPERN